MSYVATGKVLVFLWYFTDQTFTTTTSVFTVIHVSANVSWPSLENREGIAQQTPKYTTVPTHHTTSTCSPTILTHVSPMLPLSDPHPHIHDKCQQQTSRILQATVCSTPYHCPGSKFQPSCSGRELPMLHESFSPSSHAQWPKL